MDPQLKALFGSWIQAIGTVISAIGSTPLENISEDFSSNLNLYGNILQGTGNALVADTEEKGSLGKLGNEVQAIGNTTIVAGMLIDFSEETKQVLNIKGNLLQALGGGVALGDGLDTGKSPEEVYNIIGNLLQVIGNSMQAMAGIYELGDSDNDDNGELLDVYGSWIQAVGAVITALAQSK